jgi:hypothetical protein
MLQQLIALLECCELIGMGSLQKLEVLANSELLLDEFI